MHVQSICFAHKTNCFFFDAVVVVVVVVAEAPYYNKSNANTR